LRSLRRHGVRPAILHFHLRTNVSSADIYGRALDATAEMAGALGFAPRVVNCGGGFPPPFVLDRNGRRLDRHFSLAAMSRVYERALRRFPEAREIWLENGRWLCARSGVLVVRVLDAKQRRGLRHLICDGGRTLHALVAGWESHELLPLRRCRGRRVLTGVVGPTCMAFDQLARRPMHAALRAGDLLVWFDAGAYHLQWQTRFSHGLCPVLWHERGRIRQVREAEDFGGWWKPFRASSRT
jgi:diaminopimelate decarboxylase